MCIVMNHELLYSTLGLWTNRCNAEKHKFCEFHKLCLVHSIPFHHDSFLEFLMLSYIDFKHLSGLNHRISGSVILCSSMKELGLHIHTAPMKYLWVEYKNIYNKIPPPPPGRGPDNVICVLPPIMY